jgi:hypothetical protein
MEITYADFFLPLICVPLIDFEQLATPEVTPSHLDCWRKLNDAALERSRSLHSTPPHM